MTAGAKADGRPNKLSSGEVMGDQRVSAVRLKAPSWRDGRLLIGVLIVLSSVVLGARLVAAAGRTVPIFAAAADLPSGHQLTQDDLKVVPVHLGVGAADYLSAREPLSAGMVLIRPVGAGELVPAAALGPAAMLARRPVSIPVPAPLPEALRPGSMVDLWSSAKETGTGATGYAPAVRISRSSEVYATATADLDLGSANGDSSISVLLGEGELRSVLDALANSAKIAVVPLPGMRAHDAAKEPEGGGASDADAGTGGDDDAGPDAGSDEGSSEDPGASVPGSSGAAAGASG